MAAALVERAILLAKARIPEVPQTAFACHARRITLPMTVALAIHSAIRFVAKPSKKASIAHARLGLGVAGPMSPTFAVLPAVCERTELFPEA